MLSTRLKILSHICRSNCWENVFCCLHRVAYSLTSLSNESGISSLTCISRSICASRAASFSWPWRTALIYSASSTQTASMEQMLSSLLTFGWFCMKLKDGYCWKPALAALVLIMQSSMVISSLLAGALLVWGFAGWELGSLEAASSAWLESYWAFADEGTFGTLAGYANPPAPLADAPAATPPLAGFLWDSRAASWIATSFSLSSVRSAFAYTLCVFQTATTLSTCARSCCSAWP